MGGQLTQIITSPDPEVRNRSLDAFCQAASLQELLAECADLEAFRRASDNLYERVRALFFLYAIHRFHLPGKCGARPEGMPGRGSGDPSVRTSSPLPTPVRATGRSSLLLAKEGMCRPGLIPYEGYVHLLQRRFEEAIGVFLAVQRRDGPSEGISSALAEAYHKLGFQTLADQVRRSVRSVRGNQWMFRIGHPLDQPLRVRPELLARSPDGLFPILREATPVRMDLTHSGWSDIFFLGMDFPEGARVLNVSIDLAVHGRDPAPQPPVEAYFRVIDEPVLRLVSVDLEAVAEIASLAEVFDFARDYLGLLKAAVIAAGIVPPGMEGASDFGSLRCDPLPDLLARLVGWREQGGEGHPRGRGLGAGEEQGGEGSGDRSWAASASLRSTSPARGIEVVSRVNGIPKGSRLAVSTSLLASLIAVCMRATGQTHSLTGGLEEHERRLVAARAILGEWLGGSGGGWQDSGGVWPGIKLITGVLAGPDDPEYGISRGRLLPAHCILGLQEVAAETRQQLQDSLVLVHGGMAQDVGPILEMVTEKYLLRSEAEWRARQGACGILDEILGLLQGGDMRAIGGATTRNFFAPLQTIIPWATNLYTETLIERVREAFGQAFWGFWMLGGMSGSGMGFIFDPEGGGGKGERGKGEKGKGASSKEAVQGRLHELMLATKRQLEHALPFAIEPVVYDFAINTLGTQAALGQGDQALMPAGYYTLTVPRLLRQDLRLLSPARRSELDHFGLACRVRPELAGMVQTLFDRIMPHMYREGGEEERGKGEKEKREKGEGSVGGQSLEALLRAHGFDRVQHEQIRADLRSGRIGLAQNRLPASADVRDVEPGDVIDAPLLGRPQSAAPTSAALASAAPTSAALASAAPTSAAPTSAALASAAPTSAAPSCISPSAVISPPTGAAPAADLYDAGLQALRDGAVAVVTLAAGAGSRWTQGAGVVKALHPFCKLGGRHRSFLEVHLAKSRRIGRLCGVPLPHVITTSYLTHEPIRSYLAGQENRKLVDGYPGPLILSLGRAVGLRLVPMARDLRFAWEEMPQQLLDEQAQKVRDSLRAALIAWAHQAGEGSDYTDNVPLQCLHPVGHWFEVPNLFRNGVLAQLLRERPQLRCLLMHNIDTVGADVDPALLGWHLQSGAAMTVEVIARNVQDRGGGLARVDGRVRLIEGLALPHEEDEFKLSYYNSNTMWIDIDRLLAVFGLCRADLGCGSGDPLGARMSDDEIAERMRAVAARMPTYITLKDVKKRWGHGQEDVFPVVQFEKLWGDMTALPELGCRFVLVPRVRGQQLKEQAQLDGWLRDGSAAYVESLCEWGEEGKRERQPKSLS